MDKLKELEEDMKRLQLEIKKLQDMAVKAGLYTGKKTRLELS